MSRAIKLVCIIAGVGTAAILTMGYREQIGKFLYENTGNAIAGACGALFGAMVAYKFQKWKEGKDQMNARHSAVLRAQMALIFHLDSIAGITKNFGAFERKRNREMLIPIWFMPPDNYPMDLTALSFFINLKNPDLIRDLYYAQRGYANLVDSILKRNDFLEKYHAAAELKDFNMQTGAAVYIGAPREAFLLRVTTDQVYHSIKDASAKNEAALSKLTASAKAYFKGRMVLAPILPVPHKEGEPLNQAAQ